MSDADLTCGELVELVTEYLDGGLGDDARADFEEHVVVCMGCANYLDQIRATLEVVGHVSVDDLSEATKADLLAAFRGWDRP